MRGSGGKVAELFEVIDSDDLLSRPHSPLEGLGSATVPIPNQTVTQLLRRLSELRSFPPAPAAPQGWCLRSSQPRATGWDTGRRHWWDWAHPDCTHCNAAAIGNDNEAPNGGGPGAGDLFLRNQPAPPPAVRREGGRSCRGTRRRTRWALWP